MYLVRKKGGATHIWTGADTACRMWSSGGIVKKSAWVKRPEPKGKVCAMCEQAKNDPIVKYPKVTVMRSKKTKRAYWIDPKSDEFLKCYAWLTLRAKVLRKYGAQCQCCGASPADGVVMNVDHIKPRKLFPELALVEDNLQVLCHLCNAGKSNWDQTDWRPAEQENVFDPLLECKERMRIG